jgi:hypothetical protein
VAKTKTHQRRRRNDFFFGAAPPVPGLLPAPPAGFVFVAAALPLADAAAFPAFPLEDGLEACLGVYRSPVEADERSRDTVARC